jgi:hypothetical protein
VVAILGMGRMGKTALASRASEQCAQHYDAVVWRSLLNAPPLDDVLKTCLPLFSAGSITDLHARLDEQIALATRRMASCFGRSASARIRAVYCSPAASSRRS